MAADDNQPVCTEIVCSSSVGGKVQIVKFEYTADYHFSMTRKYSVPEGWAEDDVRDFQVDRTIQLRGQLEEIADAEMAELLKQRDEQS